MELSCSNLTISYHRHPAIHHLSCSFKLGATTAIIGPNGAGKSTLVKALIGELQPETGAVIHDQIASSDIAYLPQYSEIDNSLPLTVFDVVMLGFWHKMKFFAAANAHQKVDDCLEQVGLSGFNERYVSELSRGQLQRVLLARIMMQDAPIIILDEPFNAMDSKTISELLKIIKLWHTQNKTVIAVLHDLSLVAEHFEYTLLLAKECIAYDKTNVVLTPDNLKKAYASSFAWLDDNLCNLAPLV